jgi:ketosteroid isomerase-like protein
MKLILLGTIAVAAGVLASNQLSQRPTRAIEQELIRLDKEWNEAEARRDVATLERIMSSDFQSIGEDGSVETRANVLDAFRSGDVRLESIEAGDYSVSVYDDVAWMTHRATLRGTYKGQDIGSTYRTTHLWIKEDGQWRVASSQKTAIR